MTKNPVTLYKGEDEILDFQMDMSAELMGRNNGSDDALSTVDWTFSGPISNLAVASSSFTALTATVWLSGGPHGGRYQITATMTTTGGRTYERYFNLLIA